MTDEGKSPPALIALALLLAACGGGGGGGGGPTDPGTRSFFFAPAAVTAPGTMLMRRGSVRPAKVTIELVADDVDELSAVDFVVAYPAALVELDVVLNRGFLPATVTTVVPLADDPGAVRIAAQRAPGAGPFPDGTLFELIFDYAGPAGTGDVTFAAGNAFDDVGAPILGLRWLGGRLTVQ